MENKLSSYKVLALKSTVALPSFCFRALIIALLSFIFISLSSCSDELPLRMRLLPLDATVLALGDSLTFGTGAPTASSYPVVLGKLIKRRVINAGIPREESGQALQRLPKLLDEYHPKLVIICIGGNDMLRKKPEVKLKENLEKMVELAKAQFVDILIVAVPRIKLNLETPPLYAEVGKAFKVPVNENLLPTLMNNRLYKSDTVHLNKRGYNMMAKGIQHTLEKYGAVS